MPCEVGIYVIRILIEEFRDGQCVGKVNRDMQIEVVDNPNHAPDVQAVNDTCIIAGETLSLVVTATDEDIGQTNNSDRSRWTLCSGCESGSF